MAYMKDSTGRRLDGFKGISAPQVTNRIVNQAMAPSGAYPDTVKNRITVDHPRFEVAQTNWLSLAETSASSLFWLMGLDTRDVPGVADKLSLLGSTDHGGDGTTGVHLLGMNGPDKSGFVNRGRVVPGTATQPETPTPWVAWSPETVLAMCAISASADTLTKNAHGLANGTPVRVRMAAFPGMPTDGTPGIEAGPIYYVVSSTTNTFKLALTNGGAAIDLTVDGYTSIVKTGTPIIRMLLQINTGNTVQDEAQSTQETHVFESPDGLSWTDRGIAMTPSDSVPGDPIADYARTWRVGSRRYAYSTAGGGAFTVWWSDRDGEVGTWQRDPRRILGMGDEIATLDCFGINALPKLNQGSVFTFQGRHAIVCPITGPAAGVGGLAYSDLWFAFLTDDFRHFASKPTKVTPTGGVRGAHHAGLFLWDDELYLPVRQASKISNWDLWKVTA